MLLTAMAVVVGASVILFDPIFQGRAISLMGGEVASLLISRMAIPVHYFMAYKQGRRPPVVPAEGEKAETQPINREPDLAPSHGTGTTN